MKIKWVNHASFVLEFEGVKLISDPWLEGTAFNDGWALLSPTRFSYEEFKNITHIWFSHEHPDHFAPNVLKNIPLEYRQKITVLYHHTVDKKVVNFCRSLGFGETIELYPDSYQRLAITSRCWREIRNDADSWLSSKRPAHNAQSHDCYFKVRSAGGNQAQDGRYRSVALSVLLCKLVRHRDAVEERKKAPLRRR